jgi:hypothetical protein
LGIAGIADRKPFGGEEVAQLEAFPELCAAIKRMLDPKRILSPGRYGIG